MRKVEGTIIGSMLELAESDPEAKQFTYLGNGTTVTDALSREELVEQARVVAAGLKARMINGPVVMTVAPNLDFVRILFGLLFAGNPAVPLSPKGPKEGSSAFGRVIAAARQSGARAICVSDEDVDGLRSFLDSQASPPLDIDVLSVGELLNAGIAELATLPSADDIAFVQFTSGSTGNPRGVLVPHRSLTHQVRLIAKHLRLGDGVVGVLWTPPTHDLGLVGGLFASVFAGAHLVLLPPIAFLHRPVNWLRAISEFGAEVSAAPDFGYALAARRGVKPGVELDLSCWRVAITGAEPVRHETMQRFGEVFGPYGFADQAVMPIYGLAETTLVASAVPEGLGLTTVAADRTALAKGRFENAPPAGPGRTVVSVGANPDPDAELCVVDPTACELVADGTIGELWLRGESVADGYVNDPEATEARFGGRLANDDGPPFLRTGDAGFRHDEQIYITGRIVDTIVVKGRNLDPHDLEGTVRGALGLAGTDICVAVQVEDALVVVAEVSPTRLGADALAVGRSAVVNVHGVTLHQLWSSPRGGIPKTPSGKVRRSLLRQMLHESRTDIWKAVS